MAYRIEREQNGKDAIVIDGFENGIGPSPTQGFGPLLSVNLETPGEVAVGYPITNSTVTGATLGVPIADSTRFFTYSSPNTTSGSAQSYAILDDGGHVFESTSITGTWAYLSNGAILTSATRFDGLAYWLGYLWKTRSTKLDYWNGTVWVNGWDPSTGSTGGSPLFGGVKHFMYVATNNQLYITNGNKLARIFAPDPASFDPTAPATYDFNDEILDIPSTDTALSLAEVGGGSTSQSTLLIGGSFNAIYPWDKISPSFSLPIYVGDSYIKNMVSVNQNAFIFPGNTGGRGRIYITNGSQADLYFKIPDFVFGEQDPYFEWGDAIFHRNELIFGFVPTQNSGSGVIQGFAYVWALNLDTKKFRAISPLPSGSNFWANATCLIAAANPSGPGFSYIAGWSDNSSNTAIGYSGTTAGVGIGNVATDLIPIGSFILKNTFTQVEFKLRSPLQSGENITILAQTDQATTNANLTFSPTPAAGSISGVAPVNFEKNQWVRFVVSLTGNSASSGVRLKEIRIR